MPVEVLHLANAEIPIENCPRCHATFRPFLRGQVQRSPRPWWRLFWGPFRPYCALICWACKNIVGWE